MFLCCYVVSCMYITYILFFFTLFIKKSCQITFLCQFTTLVIRHSLTLSLLSASQVLHTFLSLELPSCIRTHSRLLGSTVFDFSSFRYFFPSRFGSIWHVTLATHRMNACKHTCIIMASYHYHYQSSQSNREKNEIIIWPSAVRHSLYILLLSVSLCAYSSVSATILFTCGLLYFMFCTTSISFLGRIVYAQHIDAPYCYRCSWSVSLSVSL